MNTNETILYYSNLNDLKKIILEYQRPKNIQFKGKKNPQSLEEII
jgi:hypothetical protein